MKTISLIAAIALSGLVVIAPVAAQTGGAPDPVTQAASTSEAADSAPEATDKPICRTYAPLGSRVPRKVCQTREQWAALGIDTEQRAR